MIIISIIVSFLIAYFAGENRRIGFFWAFFFSIAFSPLIGFIISKSSEKIKKGHVFEPKIEPKAIRMLRYIFGTVLFVIGSFLFIKSFFPPDEKLNYTIGFFIGAGLAGWGIYIVLDKPQIQNPIGNISS